MACRLDCIIHIDTKILFNVGCVLMTFKVWLCHAFIITEYLNFMLLKVYLLFLSYFHWYGMCEFMENLMWVTQVRPTLKLGRELDTPAGPWVQHSGSLLNAFPVVSYFYNRIRSLKMQNLNVYINSYGMPQNFIERKGSLIFKPESIKKFQKKINWQSALNT